MVFGESAVVVSQTGSNCVIFASKKLFLREDRVEVKILLLLQNDRLNRQLELICGDLTDEQVIFGHEAVDERGIGSVVEHIYGTVSRRAQQVAGVEPSQRAEPPGTASALMAYIADTHAKTHELLTALTDAQLEADLIIGSRRSPGAHAIQDMLIHAFRHVGNILDLRHLGGFETHALG